MSAINVPRLLPVSAWPEIDRRLWAAALVGAHVATLSPGNIRAAAEGYGRWIAIRMSQGGLDGATQPADRVTPDAVRAYIDGLRAVGNKYVTIVARLGQLAAALRIMAPERSFTWLHPRKLLSGASSRTVTETDEHQLRGWPALDRRLWGAGTQVGDILAGPRYAAGLRPATLRSIIVGYRRWLVFLRAEDRLDLTVTPAARITRQNVVAYVRALQAVSCNASIIARLTELQGAMRIMHPEADFRWLTSPGGRSLSSLLPISKTPIRVFDCLLLYQWGLTMMDEALNNPHPEKRRIAYRNGLIIAIFATRAPRVRSMASLRLGSTVTRNGKTYRLMFEKENVKTSRSIEYDVPTELASAIERYIDVERAELLAGRNHDWFWADKYGEPLSADNIGDMIRRQSERSFGVPFGPHRFRHAIGTTAPLVDPAHPGVAAAILGISGRMVEEHYNRATQADVANRFHTSLRKERAALESLARRQFRRRAQAEKRRADLSVNSGG